MNARINMAHIREVAELSATGHAAKGILNHATHPINPTHVNAQGLDASTMDNRLWSPPGIPDATNERVRKVGRVYNDTYTRTYAGKLHEAGLHRLANQIHPESREHNKALLAAAEVHAHTSATNYVGTSRPSTLLATTPQDRRSTGVMHMVHFMRQHGDHPGMQGVSTDELKDHYVHHFHHSLVRAALQPNVMGDQQVAEHLNQKVGGGTHLRLKTNKYTRYLVKANGMDYTDPVRAEHQTYRVAHDVASIAAIRHGIHDTRYKTPAALSAAATSYADDEAKSSKPGEAGASHEHAFTGYVHGYVHGLKGGYQHKLARKLATVTYPPATMSKSLMSDHTALIKSLVDQTLNR